MQRNDFFMIMILYVDFILPILCVYVVCVCVCVCVSLFFTICTLVNLRSFFIPSLELSDDWFGFNGLEC